MKNSLIVSALCLMAMVLTSCGSSKRSTADNYYSNPKERTSQPILKERKLKEVDKLARAETTKMRAIGIGNDYDEKEARAEALRNAQSTLASYLETTIVSLTQEYHKKAQVNMKKYSEANIQKLVEVAVSQKVSVRMVGYPEIYDASDATIQVYVCVELVKPTDQVLGEIYDQLTQDEILGTDYDKMKFIQDNKEQLQELRERQQ